MKFIVRKPWPKHRTFSNDIFNIWTTPSNSTNAKPPEDIEHQHPHCLVGAAYSIHVMDKNGIMNQIETDSLPVNPPSGTAARVWWMEFKCPPGFSLPINLLPHEYHIAHVFRLYFGQTAHPESEPARDCYQWLAGYLHYAIRRTWTITMGN